MNTNTQQTEERYQGWSGAAELYRRANKEKPATMTESPGPAGDPWETWVSDVRIATTKFIMKKRHEHTLSPTDMDEIADEIMVKLCGKPGQAGPLFLLFALDAPASHKFGYIKACVSRGVIDYIRREHAAHGNPIHVSETNKTKIALLWEAKNYQTDLAGSLICPEDGIACPAHLKDAFDRYLAETPDERVRRLFESSQAIADGQAGSRDYTRVSRARKQIMRTLH